MRLKLADSKYKLPDLAVKIRSTYGTNNRFAELVGCSPALVGLLLNGKVVFDVPKILLWSRVLGIPYESWSKYFVTEEQYNEVYNRLTGLC